MNILTIGFIISEIVLAIMSAQFFWEEFKVD